VQESGNRDASLTAALRALAGDEARVGASSRVEARLLGEVRSLARARRRRTYLAVFASAAALFLAVAVPLWRISGRRPVAETATHAAVPTGEVATAFLPLIYSNVPATGGQIVRLEVPEGALAAFGLSSAGVLDRSASRTVLADVLVGEDGLARAVRFVRPVAHQEGKR